MRTHSVRSFLHTPYSLLLLVLDCNAEAVRCENRSVRISRDDDVIGLIRIRREDAIVGAPEDKDDNATKGQEN